MTPEPTDYEHESEAPPPVNLECCALAPLPPTLRQRIAHCLFPQEHNFGPEDHPPVVGGYITTNITVDISFWHRILILLTGRVSLSHKIATANDHGDIWDKSVFNVLPPAWLEDRE